MIIAFNGLKGSGKDTAGQYLIDNYNFKRISFAKKLKDSAGALLDVDPSFFEHWKNDDDIRVVVENRKNPSEHIIDMSFRTFLQRYGTEAHRDIFGYNFWVNQAFNGFVAGENNFVITDCRFENEAHTVHSYGGIVVRIVRDTDDEKDEHGSEVPLPLYLLDYTIYNEGYLEELYSSIDSLMTNVRVGYFG